MTKKDKIKFIRSSRKGVKIIGGAKIEGYTPRELNEIIQMIGQRILAESETVARAYIESGIMLI